MFGLETDDWQFIQKNLVEPLKSKGYNVYVFGSRARGDHKKFSDLDVLIDGPGKPRSLISEIAEQLEDSSLPIKVDIVLLQDLAESYADNVLKDRVILNQ